ncbi:tetratricopeptide repeat protein [Nonomuraea sp. NPDC003214]
MTTPTQDGDGIDRAGRLCDRAVFAGDDGALEAAGRELDVVEARLAVARGRVLHARFLEDRRADAAELALFERAARLYRALGDPAGEAEALFWTGCFHQVVRDDPGTAVPLFERAVELAERAGDLGTQAYALRHLGIADHAAGRLEAARERLTESTRLRRRIGHLAGVAANQVGLVHLAIDEGRPAEARALADEAYALAESCGAVRIMRQLDQARTRL